MYWKADVHLIAFLPLYYARLIFAMTCRLLLSSFLFARPIDHLATYLQGFRIVALKFPHSRIRCRVLPGLPPNLEQLLVVLLRRRSRAFQGHHPHVSLYHRRVPY